MRRLALPLAGLVAGLWAFLPVYSGPELDVARRVEIADHVLPGVVVLAACGAAVALRLRDTMLLLAGMAVGLAGFWMTATHLPLVLQAKNGQARWGAAIYHTLPGLAVLVVGLVWILRPEPAEAAPERDQPG
ncbi:MAG: hypothetical protein KY454_12610 [Actinobacteria bacterium]|nr:hypothetical protein [Actinomycetota bacterium]MBW3651254.1 hypothetical protein [Actinomycetota bacterium]